MKTNKLINSFTTGQLTPWLAGRIDLDAYSKGAMDLTNMLPRPFGGALRRPGTKFITESYSMGLTRLIPFVFSITQSYIVEFSAGTFRFFSDGGIVLDGTVPYELTNDYTEDEIKNIQYAQSRDVLFLTCGTKPVRRLQRLGAANWEIVDLDVVGGPFQADNTTDITLDPSATTGSITVISSADLFTADMVGDLVKFFTKVDDVQGYFKITAFTSATQVSADVIETLGGAGITKDWAFGSFGSAGYPKTVTFNDSRLWLGNTDTEQDNIWGSEPFVYNNFALPDALSLGLPSKQLNAIVGMAASRDLTVVTYGAPFYVTSGTGEALTTDNISGKKQGSDGGEFVQPIVLSNYVYYVQRGGEKLREFKYNWENDGYSSSNISILNEDILQSGIKEMTVQQNEDNILWCVLNNGNIVTLTRESDQAVVAFAPQMTDGTYESAASIPREEQFYDDVYFLVKRTIDGVEKQYIELLQQPRGTELITGMFVDSGLFYDGNKTSSLDITGGVATSTEEDFNADDVGELIRIDETKYKITAFIDTYSVEVDTTDVVNTDEWALSATNISGLDHLEKKEVSVLRDGAVDPKLTVESGSVTLAKNGFYVIIGLEYESVVETFPLESVSQNIGASTGSQKRINYITLKLIDTMGIKIDGGQFDETVFSRDYTVKMGYPNNLFTGDIKKEMPNNYDVYKTAKITQNSPLPFGLVCMTLNLSTQER